MVYVKTARKKQRGSYLQKASHPQNAILGADSIMQFHEKENGLTCRLIPTQKIRANCFPFLYALFISCADFSVEHPRCS
jgi:hypothetical protein